MSQNDPQSKPLTYADAGVDIDEGARLVELIKPAAKSTARAGASAALGGFSAALDLKAAGYVDPIVLATTDGVGTKLKIAIETGLHDGVGVDLVAMCVNDLLAQGGEPLLFLDYYATGKLNADQGAAIVGGIAEGCRQAGCALAGGETAEMPGLYAPGDYDLAGFALGAVERGAMLPRLEGVADGDVLIGVGSSGPHSNGYSLVRKIVTRSGLSWDAPAPFAHGQTLAQALLTPTRIYVKALLPILRSGLVHGGAHITGGGLIENTPRALPADAQAVFTLNDADWAPVFHWLQAVGHVESHEMMRTFNCGFGFVLVCPPANVARVLSMLSDAHETARPIGTVARR